MGMGRRMTYEAFVRRSPRATVSLSPRLNTIMAFPACSRTPSQASVHDTLLAMGARSVGGPQIVIGNVAEKVVRGEFVDRASLSFALGRINQMVKGVRRSESKRPRAAASASLPADFRESGWLGDSA
jgi:hypothetical protein